MPPQPMRMPILLALADHDQIWNAVAIHVGDRDCVDQRAAGKVSDGGLEGSVSIAHEHVYGVVLRVSLAVKFVRHDQI